MRDALVVGLVSVVSCSMAGCGTTYTPRQSGRVSMVMRGGSPGYVRDGQFYRSGVFNGQLLEAVRGNEGAEYHARKYQSHARTGFGLTMAGLAVALGGLVAVEAPIFTVGNHGFNGALFAPGFAAVSSGIVLEIVGLMVSLSAQPHIHDAINMYNDGVMVTAPPPPSPEEPRASPAVVVEPPGVE